MIHGLGVPVGVPPLAPHWFPEWTEPLVPARRRRRAGGAGGPLLASQNAEPSSVTAFELHILLEVVDAVVGGIPSVAALDGAIFIPRGIDEDTTQGDPAGPVLLEEILVHLPNGKEFWTQND